MQSKTLVWTLPTRLIHWFLAILVLSSYFSGGEAQWIGWHALAGLLAGILLGFRIVWGLIGPWYSRFTHFAFTAAMTARLASKSGVDKRAFPGHSLEASWVMVAIYGVLFFVVTSGILAYGGEEGTIFMFQTGLQTAELAANVHEGMLPALWILIVIHLIGVVMSVVDNRETGVFWSMITGYKNVTARQAILSGGQRWFAAMIAFLLLLFTLFFGYRIINTAHLESPSSEIIIDDDHD